MTKEEAERVAEIMFKRWNEKKHRSRGMGPVVDYAQQIDKPQVFYPKYCYLCRAWHVTSDSVTPRNNQLHSKYVREFRKQQVGHSKLNQP